MDEDTKKAITEIKDGIKNDPDFRKEVAAEVVKELPQRKDIFAGDEETSEERKLEEKKNAAKYLHAKLTGDLETAKALSGGTSTGGAELVPAILGSEFSKVAASYGVVRKDAFYMPVANRSVTLPTLGDVVAYRIGEGVHKQSSQPVSGGVPISIKKLVALVPMTDELIQDSSINLVDTITKLGGRAISKLEDQWGFLGLAATEGIFQNTSIPVITMGAGLTTYAAATLDHLMAMIGAVNEDALDGAKWYMSFSAFLVLRGLKDTTGRYLTSDATSGAPATLLGYPIEFVSIMPKTSAGSQTSTKFIAFGNLKYMIYADRQEYSVDVSNEATIKDVDNSTAINLFAQDMTAVRIVERVDIVIADPTAFSVLRTAAA